MNTLAADAYKATQKNKGTSPAQKQQDRQMKLQRENFNMATAKKQKQQRAMKSTSSAFI